MTLEAHFFAVLKKISIFPQLIAYRHIYNEDSPQFQDICAFSARMHQREDLLLHLFSYSFENISCFHVDKDLWQKKAVLSEGN